MKRNRDSDSEIAEYAEGCMKMHVRGTGVGCGKNGELFVARAVLWPCACVCACRVINTSMRGNQYDVVWSNQTMHGNGEEREQNAGFAGGNAGDRSRGRSEPWPDPCLRKGNGAAGKKKRGPGKVAFYGG